jgi:hypothetical protein
VKKKFFLIIVIFVSSISILYVYYKHHNYKKYFNSELEHLQKISSYNYKKVWKITKNLIIKDQVIKKSIYENKIINPISQKVKIENKNYKFDRYKLYFLPRTVVNEYDGPDSLKNTGYIEHYNDFYIYINGDGTLISIKLNEKNLKTDYIKTNIIEIIQDHNFYSLSTVGIKDMRIFDDRIYISYLKNYPDKAEDNDCYNLAVLESDKLSEINFLESDQKKINFNNFFEFNHRCTSVIANNTNQNGGRLEKINNYFYITVGDFRIPGTSQDLSNNYGKIIKFKKNLKNQFKIISLGHRNPQGFFHDEDENVLIITEHGPNGGDEINLIDLKQNDEKIKNFGWDISSYGIHYSGDKNLPKLKKSHKQFGFIEPIKYFTPSIAIQDIKKINFGVDKLYVLSSLGSMPQEGDLSLHFFKIEDQNYIEKGIANLGQRIRDLAYNKNENKLILVLENPTEIGVLHLN